MGSWRDRASQQAQADLDGLLDAALGFAQHELDSHGEFFPYAVVIDTRGQTETIAARPDADDDQPNSTAVVDACVAAVTSQPEFIRACGIITDVRLPNLNTVAIQVELEHSEGHALTVQLPYMMKRRGRTIEFGQLRAVAGHRRIWP